MPVAATTAYPHIEQPAGEQARLESVPRFRVLDLAMAYVAHGWSVDEMCRQYEFLTPAQAHSAMAYYFDHQQEMDRQMAEELELANAWQAKVPRLPWYLRMKAQGKL